MREWCVKFLQTFKVGGYWFGTENMLYLPPSGLILFLFYLIFIGQGAIGKQEMLIFPFGDWIYVNLFLWARQCLKKIKSLSLHPTGSGVFQCPRQPFISLYMSLYGIIPVFLALSLWCNWCNSVCWSVTTIFFCCWLIAGKL